MKAITKYHEGIILVQAPVRIHVADLTKNQAKKRIEDQHDNTFSNMCIVNSWSDVETDKDYI